MREPSARVREHLAVLYPELDDLTGLADQVLAAIEPQPAREAWSERDAICITYGDTLVEEGRPPLQVLEDFVREHLGDAISTVHILPFFPSSSDRGFAVVDYFRVDPALGTWDDIAAIGTHADVMIDLVANHVSASSEWFAQFLEDREPGRRYFVEADPRNDHTSVVRPRALPLLREVETAAGPKHVWCTFGPDQIDLDYTNPELLVEMMRVVGRYVAAGARFLRLDAIAYLWKEPGTPSIHLPQTHELVRLLRTVLDARAPGTVLVTETNVPQDQNIGYFGAGDEAQVIYNFSLPPLVLHALHHGDSERLQSWLGTLPEPSGCTYLNFLASHDGIGVRPAEGLLSDVEIQELVALSRRAGGTHSRYDAGGRSLPYELNVGLWDLLGGHDRFVAAHALVLALAGIPALYIHSLLATPNDRDAVGQTGDHRAINRARLDWPAVRRELSDPRSPRSAALHAIRHLLTVRAEQPAFHPGRPQRAVDLGPGLVAVERTSPEQRITAVTNVTGRPQRLDRPNGFDLISASEVPAGSELGPYQAVWLV